MILGVARLQTPLPSLERLSMKSYIVEYAIIMGQNSKWRYIFVLLLVSSTMSTGQNTCTICSKEVDSSKVLKCHFNADILQARNDIMVKEGKDIVIHGYWIEDTLYYDEWRGYHVVVEYSNRSIEVQLPESSSEEVNFEYSCHMLPATSDPYVPCRISSEMCSRTQDIDSAVSFSPQLEADYFYLGILTWSIYMNYI